MSNTALSRVDAAEIMERVITTGDLGKLSPQDRVQYYGRICESVGLNPLTRPFEYIVLQGKMTLYARKDATDQLRKLYNVSLTIASRDRLEDVYIVTARATMPDGRADESTGVVSIGNLKGDNLANALMKAETKAKRRVTLSICGLGWLDESETQTIADARPVRVDATTGEIIEGPQEPASRPAPQTSRPIDRKKAITDIRTLWNEERQLTETHPEQDGESSFDLEDMTDDALKTLYRNLRARVMALRPTEEEWAAAA